MGVSQGERFKMEIVTMTITIGSATASVSGSANFKNTYNNAPLVVYAGATQTVGYIDVILEPFIAPPTTSSFTCKFTASYNGSQNQLQPGTLVTQFLVVGN